MAIGFEFRWPWMKRLTARAKVRVVAFGWGGQPPREFANRFFTGLCASQGTV